MILRSGGYTEHLFKNSAEGTIYQRLFDHVIKGREDTTFLHNYKAMLEKLTRDDQMVLYGVRETVMTIKEFECEWSTPMVSNYPSHLASALPKGSIYKEILFVKLMTYLEQGTFR